MMMYKWDGDDNDDKHKWDGVQNWDGDDDDDDEA